MRKFVSLFLTVLTMAAMLVAVMPSTTAMAAGNNMILSQDGKLRLVFDSPLATGYTESNKTITVGVRVEAVQDVNNLSLGCLGYNISSDNGIITNISLKAGETYPKDGTSFSAWKMDINTYLAAGTHEVNLIARYGDTTTSTFDSPIQFSKTSAPTRPDSVAPLPGEGDQESTSNDKSAVVIDPSASVPVITGKPGETIRVDLPLMNRSAIRVGDVRVWPNVTTDVETYPFVIDNVNNIRYIGTMGTSGKATATFNFTISDKATNGTKAMSFTIAYYELGSYYEHKIDFYVTVTGAVSKPDESEVENPIVLQSKDTSGKTVSTPSGDVGDKVTVVLPMRNRGNDITDVEVYPNLSADVAQFPFRIENASYSRKVGAMKTNDCKDVSYTFTIADKATSGVKAIGFTVIYKENGVAKQMTVTSYVNVRKGYVAPENGGVDADGKPLVVQPKVIISSYSVPERIFAGEEFELKFVIKNTSDTDEIRNLKITLKNDEGIILPAANGSNTLFVKSLKTGEETELSIMLQSSPDAPSKPQMLGMTFEYNNAKVNAFTSNETLTLPIAQKMRVTVDEPRIFVDGATVGNSFNATINIYNKGKGQLYNVSLKLESEGDTMRLEEGYFGGNLQSGGSTTADVNIIPTSAGDLFGKFLITYEDEYGEVYTEEKEFTAYVTEPMDFSDPGMMGGDMEMYPTDMPDGEGQGMATWLKIVLGAAGAAVLIVLVILLRKRARQKREKELEA